jgi:hypothetical protein
VLLAGVRLQQAKLPENVAVMDEVTNQMGRVGLDSNVPKVQDTPGAVLINRVKQIEDMGKYQQALAMLKAAEKQHIAPLHTVIQCASRHSR